MGPEDTGARTRLGLLAMLAHLVGEAFRDAIGDQPSGMRTR
jgi:hypothetical protein